MSHTMTPVSREDIAKRDIGSTEISKSVSRIFVTFFMATILSVPTIQVVHNLIAKAQGQSKTVFPAVSLAINIVRSPFQGDVSLSEFVPQRAHLRATSM